MGYRSTDDPSGVDTVDLVQLQVDIETQREDIQRIGNTGIQIVSKFENSITQVEREVRQLSDSMDSLRKDGTRQHKDLTSVRDKLEELKYECPNNSLLKRLEQQFHTTDEVVSELRRAISKTAGENTSLRTELSKTQEQLEQLGDKNTQLSNEASETRQLAEESVITAREYASEVTSLRQEMKQLRAELAKQRSAPETSHSQSFPSNELDILASSISRIGNRASQVESLQMEFELFKSRVQRLEARPSFPTQASQHEKFGSAGIYPAEKDKLPGPPQAAGHQKRKVMPPEDEYEFHVTPKRAAVTSDYSSASTAAPSSIDEWQQLSPTTNTIAKGPAGPRLTKSGAIDKRSVKRGVSSSKKQKSAVRDT